MTLRNLWLLSFFIAVVASAQNPQTQTAPIYAVNAKYTNGVAPGYAPTAGSGLNLALGPGTANCAGTIITYTGGTIALTASTTNYVYLNTTSSCAPAVKTSAFVAADIPVAVVVASGSGITSITDDRTFFNTQGGGGGSGAGAPSSSLQFNNAGAFGGANADWNSTTANAFTFGQMQAMTASAYSCNGTTCTLIGTNTFLTGQQILTGASFPGNTCMENALATVLSTGLSSSQFEFAESSTSCTGTITGTSGSATSGPVTFDVNAGIGGVTLATSGTSGEYTGQINLETNVTGGYESGDINLTTTTTALNTGNIHVATNTTGNGSGDVNFTAGTSGGSGANYLFTAAGTSNSSGESGENFGVALSSTDQSNGTLDSSVSFDQTYKGSGGNFEIDSEYDGPSGGGTFGGYGSTFVVELNAPKGGTYCLGPGGADCASFLLSADSADPTGGNFILTTTGVSTISSANITLTAGGLLTLDYGIGGPATAPTGSCTVIGWVFSQDGHVTFCNGSSWVTKI